MKYKEILEEKYLPSQFKFGFEFEAIFPNDLNILSIANKYFSDFNDENIVDDSSIKNYNEYDYIGIELKSPVLEFTPNNIIKSKKFLIDYLNNGAYTNNSCGFHIHFSFPNIKSNDLKWIICQLALNKKLLNKILYLDNIEFFNNFFANYDFMDELTQYINTKDYSEINELLNNEKYRILKIHQQGTLEWRGPRNFMNNKNMKNIDSFFIRVYEFIKILSNLLDNNMLGSISRTEFNSNMNNKNIAFKPDIKIYDNFSTDQDLSLIFNIYKHNPWLKNADFYGAEIELDENNNIIWKNGKWINGIWENGTWENGEWYKGTWFNGRWENGEWNNGTWINGTWYNGEWYDGTWEDGLWKDGEWYDGTWKDGLWEDGLWVNGEWKDGTWRNGTWCNGEIWSNNQNIYVKSNISPNEFKR